METAHYQPRTVDPLLAKALHNVPAILLHGPLACGKTTTASNHAESIVRLPHDLEALQADTEGFLKALPTPVLIDEWQLGGIELLWVIKKLIDEDPSPGRFILTGSVEPASYGQTYPLTGRSMRIQMRPMSRREIAGMGNEPSILHDLAAGTEPQPTVGRAAEFAPGDMFTTGFPGARMLEDPSMVLESYAMTVSQRAGDMGRDASRVMRTLRVLATLESQAVPNQQIWEAADINKTTWKAYEDLLVRTALDASLPAFSTNALQRLTSYPKRFLCDTAMSLTLADVHPGDMDQDRALFGQYFESFVMQQIRPPADAHGWELSHIRTGAGSKEVDCIIETSNGIIGIEVKAGVQPKAADAKHLNWLRDELGPRFIAGLVVHTGPDVRPLGERVFAVPVTDL